MSILKRILNPLLVYLRKYVIIRDRKIIQFSGWEMITDHALPWVDNYQWENFRKSCEDIKKKFEFGPDNAYTSQNVDTLRWRHWYVVFSAHYALEFIKIPRDDQQHPLHFVECGVADGVTAYFLLKELQPYPKLCYSLHLYDSWQAMRKENLTASEIGHVGTYSNLNFKRTQKNLSFDKNITFHPGFIPETLTTGPAAPADQIVYLHIDLNSANPTLAALEFFYSRIVSGGVILFDDYGWTQYRDTKEVIDKFLSDKPGILLKMATGQALFLVK